MEMKQMYKQAGNTFVLKVLGLSSAFIFQIILGRTLTAETYGEFTMFVTYSTILSIVSILGMDRNLIKEIARINGEIEKENKFLKFAMRTSILIFVGLALGLIIINVYVREPFFGVSILVIMIFIRTVTSIMDGYLQGKGLIVQVTFINSLLNNVLKIILFIFFISRNVESLKAAVISFIISEIITMLLRLKYFKRIFKDTKYSTAVLENIQKKNFLKYSLTVALISGIGLLLQNIDKIMISSYLDFEDVGVYKVAQNYVSLISIFITPFMVFWPMISKFYIENKIIEIENEMKKIVRIVTALVIPMFFIFLFRADTLLAIFGDNYVSNEAKMTLIILSFAFLIDAISGPIGSILTMTKYAKLSLYNNLIALITNITLNFLFIDRFGIIGVALATGISVILNNLLSILQVKLILGIYSYDLSTIYQIILLGSISVVTSICLTEIKFIDNLYLELIFFGIVIYITNAILFFVFERNKILKKTYSNLRGN